MTDHSSCPPWCSDKDSEAHPHRHESYPVGVDVRRPGPLSFNALLVQDDHGVRVVLGVGDEDDLEMTTQDAREFGEGLIRLVGLAESARG